MRVGSMFAGIGGICSAFKQSGAEIVWANEIDEYACATYRRNFGDNYLQQGDIKDINLAAVPDMDVLTAGFPCQPFSVMGRQEGFADPRGTMFFEILRVIDSKTPTIVLLENVKNLVNHDDGRTFKTISHSLTERGYSIKYAVLGAHTHANIPQYRDRIFIAAFCDQKQWDDFSFPAKQPLTVKINDIVDRLSKKHGIYYYGEDSRYHEKLSKCMTDDNAIYRIDDSGVAMRSWRICPTLKANMGTYHDRVPLVHDEYGYRKLTLFECLAFQGFPRDYQLAKIPVEQIYKQIGNTVCVPVVKGISDELMRVWR